MVVENKEKSEEIELGKVFFSVEHWHSRKHKRVNESHWGRLQRVFDVLVIGGRHMLIRHIQKVKCMLNLL
jgi:hypothetical protein